MRLKKIKLVGFKSFVDPTSLPLPSNRMAIVGPNGCGKSNIIDAVRWVMGESSAKHLRGDSMADVIFNGSTSRKPVGQCSVELVFDNSKGNLGGQYAAYNEIAIKRQVSRDGQSCYFLNGARCRRRDITDIFLGTGLGPRSYAIIEQGMISRLIEAKPEELRVFLEEAAGISKYKERRRETENRMGHTVDNLNRINDLREEIERQLNTLKRQAKQAEKYQELKQLKRKIKAQIEALRWRALNEEAHQQNRQIEHQETLLEGCTADLRRVEAQLEQQGEALHQARDKAVEIQEIYYSQGAEIARLEQQLHHQRAQRAQHQQEQAQIAHRLTRTEQLQEEKSALIGQTRQALVSHVESERGAQQQFQAAQEMMETTETAMQDWQASWDDFNQRAAEPTQRAQVERSRQQQLTRQQEQLQQRRVRLEEEARQLLEGDDANLLEELREEQFILEQELARQQKALADCVAQAAEYREQEKQLSRKLHGKQRERHHLQGRLASLQALQQAALGRSDGGADAWLAQQNLADSLRLAEGLEVEPGWEQAVERALGIHMEAVCVAGWERLADGLLNLEAGSLILFDTAVSAQANRTESGVPLLLSKVRAPWPLDSILGGVYAVETLAEALVLRASLAPGESIMTRNGIWLSLAWLSLVREDDGKLGALARGREIARLQEEMTHCEREVEALDKQLEEVRGRFYTLESEQERQQKVLHQFQRELGGCQSALARVEAKQEQHQLRQRQVQEELEEIQTHLAEDERERQLAETCLQEALMDMESFAEEREQLIKQRDRLRASLNQLRGETGAAKDNLHRLEMEGHSLQTTLEATQQAVIQIRREYNELLQRREALEVTLASGETPLQELQTQLETHLQQRMSIERQLNEARERVTRLESQLRTDEQKKHEIGRTLESQRTSLERLRVDRQAIWVRAQTLKEPLQAAGFSPEEILREMSEESDLAALEAESERIALRIQRLGLINLAAIDECRIQAERKQYLDAQHADLTEALQTLENAIERIDRETRRRFRETFDKVNGGLQTLFPKLFGGGKAYLELNDDDLLNTGVKIMARPPGKRNSTIHLLSGGEKALTAVALVFAIFQLNPAPFCMLDEVDAPLDDANVERFCELVKEMSVKLQFIIVTHNKVTMEIGHQLTGVTMHEPGVSRLVAVDVDEAVQLAAI
ncbi:condensin subunit Smc [Nitrosococcus oceani ATCC 19707]|uniref:Chromosome partition protein Smc n=2 Tax=Nitrosococcus oceani TaxID=1229 RepID=Q3JAH9_NITOC|nr:chromosome segregation protein SMC [Nitrosococcus oceani]ABA58167.1 condensin subunit Smc [Nitrosococcus oceani ATCC 19707]EDZ67851.1 chromosome segregation protein SMC [Nitrosococcus oceani AFC27]KFI19381.1 chromosome segregation protein SMC [Nitrosococcus oceani C-27]GEM20387.1 chromosome segregation protein SMC [Nitrosococcus oceani]